jgi:hypothetical protein
MSITQLSNQDDESMARKPSPVMSLAAKTKVEAIKVSCDIEGREIFSVLGNKKKEIPMKACAAVVNKTYSELELHGATLMRDKVSVIDASKKLIAANNKIFSPNLVTTKYMENFVKDTCRNKNNGNSCPI